MTQNPEAKQLTSSEACDSEYWKLEKSAKTSPKCSGKFSAKMRALSADSDEAPVQKSCLCKNPVKRFHKKLLLRAPEARRSSPSGCVEILDTC